MSDSIPVPNLPVRVAISTRLQQLENIIERGLAPFVEVGKALQQIREGRLYREAGYTRFEDYCRERWGWSRIHAHRQIEAAKVAGILLPTGNTPASERQARELARVKTDGALDAEAIKKIVLEVPLDRTSARELKEIIDTRVTLQDKRQSMSAFSSSESFEWFSPAKYIGAAREVMGGIDLDPASCAAANETVRAKKYYSKEDDGLVKGWYGRLWMNPPYSGLGPSFIRKLVEEFDAGHVQEAIVLVNASTATNWFQPLWNYPVCFTDHRIRFVAGSGKVATSPPHGSVFAFLGPRPERFRDAFQQFGKAVRVWK